MFVLGKGNYLFSRLRGSIIGRYAQTGAISADRLVTPGSDGRYPVGRGEPITVVTAAPLPAGFTHCYPRYQPLARPPPGRSEQCCGGFGRPGLTG